ncbi:MAG: bifunctional glycosyltransferase/CDP-glycerol:glycerophosphate glycerophosphotransferase, partial [Peptostreptococcaceae bacterium]
MSTPKISIIIPVYNVEDYIGLTIESLLNQTLKEIEIILIDDGSTDNSKDIISRYADKYKNIKVMFQQNSGPSKARNKGIKEATGEYIVFVDSDDLLPEDSLEIRYNTAVNENAEVVIGGTYKFDSKRKWPMKKHFLGNEEKDIRTSDDILWTVGPCNKIFKTSLIRNIKFPENIKYAEDQVFVMEAYLKANKIYSVNETIYLYRMRETESNHSLSQQIYHDSSNVIRQVYDVWTITCENIDKNIKNHVFANNIKSNYLNRLAEADIWPAFKSAIISKNKEVQKHALEYAINLVECIDEEVLRKQPKFRWIMSKGMIDKYLFIDKSNHRLCIKLLTVLFNKLDEESIHDFKLEQKYFIGCMQRAVKYQSNIYIKEFLIRRKIIKFKNKFNKKNRKKYINKLCTKDVFKVASKLPVKKNNVILATNRGYELEGNLDFINEEIKKHNDFKVIIYPKRDNTSNWELVKMYYNFARAKFIILDDYYRQLYGYKFRKETDVIQVWHACGAFKKFGISAVGQGDSNSMSFEKKAHSHYTTVITSASEINKHYANAFNISEDKILPLGVPRTDVILDDGYRENIKLKLENKYPCLKGKKIITYAPTFRGGPKERH